MPTKIERADVPAMVCREANHEGRSYREMTSLLLREALSARRVPPLPKRKPPAGYDY